ncbi:Uncharacterised protein [Klebsiella oxytoca]|nr:Uncharacterised protein [Klebsiella oxytoca]
MRTHPARHLWLMTLLLIVLTLLATTLGRNAPAISQPVALRR